jgi:hypothetical protein
MISLLWNHASHVPFPFSIFWCLCSLEQPCRSHLIRKPPLVGQQEGSCTEERHRCFAKAEQPTYLQVRTRSGWSVPIRPSVSCECSDTHSVLGSPPIHPSLSLPKNNLTNELHTHTQSPSRSLHFVQSSVKLSPGKESLKIPYLTYDFRMEKTLKELGFQW